MALEKSKFARKKPSAKEANQWREVKISEEILKSALEYILRYSVLKILKRGEMLERVIVSEATDHTYSLSVAISKEGRSEMIG